MQEVRLLILGTRTLAEEIADFATDMPGVTVAGFVENMDRSRCESELAGLPVYWVDGVAGLAKDHLAVCGLATTHRKSYVEQVRALGLGFATLVHPTARVSGRATLGEGCIVSPFAAVSSNTALGRHVFVNRGALIGHHTTIGDFATVQPGANIAGMVTMGEGSYIGMGAVVLDNIRIGAHSVVGAGSVVTKDVPEGAQVIGVPARVVRTDLQGK